MQTGLSRERLCNAVKPRVQQDLHPCWMTLGSGLLTGTSVDSFFSSPVAGMSTNGTGGWMVSGTGSSGSPTGMGSGTFSALPVCFSTGFSASVGLGSTGLRSFFFSTGAVSAFGFTASFGFFTVSSFLGFSSSAADSFFFLGFGASFLGFAVGASAGTGALFFASWTPFLVSAVYTD